MQQKPKKVIQIYLEEEQIKWLDANKGPELKRSGLIRTIIREKMNQEPPTARIWRKVNKKDNDL